MFCHIELSVVYPVSCWWIFLFFPDVVFDFTNNAAKNTFLHVSYCTFSRTQLNKLSILLFELFDFTFKFLIDFHASCIS